MTSRRFDFNPFKSFNKYYIPTMAGFNYGSLKELVFGDDARWIMRKGI